MAPKFKYPAKDIIASSEKLKSDVSYILSALNIQVDPSEILSNDKNYDTTATAAPSIINIEKEDFINPSFFLELEGNSLYLKTAFARIKIVTDLQDSQKDLVALLPRLALKQISESQYVNTKDFAGLNVIEAKERYNSVDYKAFNKFFSDYASRVIDTFQGKDIKDLIGTFKGGDRTKILSELKLDASQSVEEPTDNYASIETPAEEPTTDPVQTPTETPTEVPSTDPTQMPTETPTQVPSTDPTQVPSETPTIESFTVNVLATAAGSAAITIANGNPLTGAFVGIAVNYLTNTTNSSSIIASVGGAAGGELFNHLHGGDDDDRPERPENRQQPPAPRDDNNQQPPAPRDDNDQPPAPPRDDNNQQPPAARKKGGKVSKSNGGIDPSNILPGKRNRSGEQNDEEESTDSSTSTDTQKTQYISDWTWDHVVVPVGVTLGTFTFVGVVTYFFGETFLKKAGCTQIQIRGTKKAISNIVDIASPAFRRVIFHDHDNDDGDNHLGNNGLADRLELANTPATPEQAPRQAPMTPRAPLAQEFATQMKGIGNSATAISFSQKWDTIFNGYEAEIKGKFLDLLVKVASNRSTAKGTITASTLDALVERLGALKVAFPGNTGTKALTFDIYNNILNQKLVDWKHETIISKLKYIFPEHTELLYETFLALRNDITSEVPEDLPVYYANAITYFKDAFAAAGNAPGFALLLFLAVVTPIANAEPNYDAPSEENFDSFGESADAKEKFESIIKQKTWLEQASETAYEYAPHIAKAVTCGGLSFAVGAVTPAGPVGKFAAGSATNFVCNKAIEYRFFEEKPTTSSLVIESLDATSSVGCYAFGHSAAQVTDGFMETQSLAAVALYKMFGNYIVKSAANGACTLVAEHGLSYLEKAVDSSTIPTKAEANEAVDKNNGEELQKIEAQNSTSTFIFANNYTSTDFESQPVKLSCIEVDPFYSSSAY